MSRRETPSSLVLGRVAWSEFGRLGRSVLDPRVILTHAFLAYVPISIAVATGPIIHRMLPIFAIEEEARRPVVAASADDCCAQPR